ncbi:MAG: hypothetical protein EAZ84_04890 [Verrucomicrobia bacterium]|nr:MAG: hypothetical protein EAZ84_04890 [Verrucomicrobiota bacterium]TAE88640.1 MAG: hypothetical protein EAZ82_02725 [Verrucomicrobiota bacterium]TAF26442.1 MAG: hypothetical protein EAZ71_04250 [Verrucomicrobiota bacterium]
MIRTDMGGLPEGIGNFHNDRRPERLRHHDAQHETSGGGLYRNHLEHGIRCYSDVDMTRLMSGGSIRLGQATRQKIQFAEGDILKHGLPFAIEDEDALGSDVPNQQFPETKQSF